MVNIHDPSAWTIEGYDLGTGKSLDLRVDSVRSEDAPTYVDQLGILRDGHTQIVLTLNDNSSIKIEQKDG